MKEILKRVGLLKHNSFNVFTHHKCASTWLKAYLAEFCDLNGLHLSSTHLSNEMPTAFGDVRLFLNASYEFVKSRNLKGPHLIRNPLAILASAYHSHLKTHPSDIWPELCKQRRDLQLKTIEDGYASTIRFLQSPKFGAQTIGPFLALKKWDFSDPSFQTIRMEDVVVDISSCIGPSLKQFFGDACLLPQSDKFSFSAFAGNRAVGQIDETSHYRSGHPLQWQTDLPPTAVADVKQLFPDLLDTYYGEQLPIRASSMRSD